MAILFSKKKEPVRLDGSLRHIAFIMDGNGRWAQKRGMPREYGHRAGAGTFRKIATHCDDLGLQAMTVYAFSTENWRRPPQEVNAIMDLLEEYLNMSEQELRGRSIQFHFPGDCSVLRPALQERMREVEEKTAGNRMILNIAINYGGRTEICHALEKVRQSDAAITEQAISDALYTAGTPDPDLIVRTGGELRLSNFLLWQAAYSELYFSDKLWPDFTAEDVDDAIRAFYSRKRRFGGV